MPFKGLRDFLEALERSGDVVRVDREVDWNLEAGAITRRVCEIGERAPLFLRVKDYPGHRMLGAPLATYRRFAVAMGLPPDTPVRAILDEFDRRSRGRLKPRVVDRSQAPCKQNVMRGEEVDLFRFPAPMVHEGDGGRYLATFHLVVTRDLDSDWVNWGMYRVMVHNRNTMGGLILPGQDIGRMYVKYEAAGRPMPYAIVIGPDPMSAVASCMSPGPGETEADIAGALNGEPVEVVRCETCDLYVPAHAEIVIEGEVLPKVRVEEGPFGEYTGYRTSPRMPRPVFTVKCVTWRDDPIVPIANMGVPVDDSHIIFSVTQRQDVLNAVSRFPITGVYVPPESAGHVAIIGVHKVYEHIAQHVADAMWGSKMGYVMPYCIVVDADVDVYDMGQVLHALFTKLHPIRGVHGRPGPGHGLFPFMSLEERRWGKGAHLLLDCTWPFDWREGIERPQRAGFTTIYPKELQERVLANWKAYGF